MMPFMQHAGAYMIPTGVFTLCTHLEPTEARGLNSQIWLVEDTLMLKPPRMYNLLLHPTADDWPGAQGTTLPGGFAVGCNKQLYILGGFNINVSSTNQIWEFNPLASVGSKWVQRVNTPVGIMYAPACCINGIIYVGGASDYSAGTVIDTTNSFSFNPATNSIGTIAPIPRATGETRGLNFNGKMLVMGGGRVAPNPSNEVDAYDPVTNTWSVNIPIPAFMTARRNFATDTGPIGGIINARGIWLAGGYAPTSPTDSTEVFCSGSGPTPT